MKSPLPSALLPLRSLSLRGSVRLERCTGPALCRVVSNSVITPPFASFASLARSPTRRRRLQCRSTSGWPRSNSITMPRPRTNCQSGKTRSCGSSKMMIKSESSFQTVPPQSRHAPHRAERPSTRQGAPALCASGPRSLDVLASPSNLHAVTLVSRFRPPPRVGT